MALTVNVVKRKILAGEEAGQEKFFGQVRASGTTSFEQLCERISSFSTATRGDVELVLNGFLLVVSNHLTNGDIIEMNNLGTMRMTASSRGADSKEEFSTHLMKKGRILFKPGKTLRRVIDTATFQRAGKQVVIVGCTRPHVEQG